MLHLHLKADEINLVHGKPFQCVCDDNLFVCLEFFVPFEKFSLIWKGHHCRWRAANFDLCSALLAIEQSGFFRVPHLLWHGTSFYNGHLRGHATLSSNAESLAVELLLPVLTNKVCRGWDSNTQPAPPPRLVMIINIIYYPWRIPTDYDPPLHWQTH